ncbi:recombinase family protein [Mycolicibacterium canariasense]|uniref:recombinase family protein n=1 Tax=Mycolicibacterium canariasense TaxID=228230 RepID=UPI0032D5A166
MDHEDLSVIGCACLVTTPIPEVLTYFRSPRRSQPVWELHLGRSAAEVTRTIADLDNRQILLRALREGVDTATPTGRAVAGIMATLAELELELGRERRAASRASRRDRQLPATKPPQLNRERQRQLRRLAATGEPVVELAAAFGISRATAYRYLTNHEERQQNA